MTGKDFIDLDRYPIDAIGSPARGELLNDIRVELRATGCAVLPGFIKAECIPALVDEARAVAPAAHRSFNKTNAYFTASDESLPPEHPVRRFYDRSNAFVPADNFGDSSPLRAIYEWQPVMDFVQASLEEDEFHRYADPLADVIVNVTEEGNGFPWHFDTNNYTVTLAIQNGDTGGLFEYVPNLRSAELENYAGVQAVLDGDRAAVQSLHLNPGDLQIFKGRYSLHRVTPVSGKQTRYVGIFSWVDKPGMVAKVERAKQLYGKALPVHYTAEGRERTDELLD